MRPRLILGSELDNGQRSRCPAGLQPITRRVMVSHDPGLCRFRSRIDLVRTLGDLRVPPGNRLEALRADRQGQHSIRINDQWRICFIWDEGGPSHVEIVDYHV
ncbi:type II toxin-antitoxin system RelE/ParE family toxin [Bradyrhizobium sp. dw_411]|uniref:type II toxin-antitoxin system RelE/ParE family toxin n=1 Tax=Bradyrhizobium sp. dw_411 TaxID=2720082 RepID=UPI0031FEF36E